MHGHVDHRAVLTSMDTAKEDLESPSANTDKSETLRHLPEASKRQL